MPGIEHTHITRLACSRLPSWQQQFIDSQRQALIDTYCKLPDMYFDTTGENYLFANRYYFATDGIQFHYLPDTPVVPLYRYYGVDREQQRLHLLQDYKNSNWRHASRGFTWYTRHAIEALREGNLADGLAYAGWLLHMLQDYSYGNHSLEGPYGTDIFVLNRLFPEADDPDLDPMTIVSRSAPPPEADQLVDLTPRLLGVTPEEIALHLYTEHLRTTCQARQLCLQIVVNARQNNAHLNAELFHRMYRGAVQLSASVLYTLVCNASQQWPETDLDALRRVWLSDLEPIQRPWLLSSPYRTRALMRDTALAPDRTRIPLSILPAKGEPATTIGKGFGLGAHYECRIAYELPAGLYDRFTCRIGLQSQVAELGDVRVALTVDGREQAAGRLHADQPAIAVDVADPAGRLELSVVSDVGLAAPHNHLVWAEPLLHRHSI